MREWLQKTAGQSASLRVDFKEIINAGTDLFPIPCAKNWEAVCRRGQ
jgi:hypothetical protein